MITKFERKVIAGLTAFLMCLSMVLAVPVSVNAEAEQTQDEAVSGAKQEETVSDVQMQDETVNDAQQDVTTGEEVEEGAAGDIQKLPGMSAESTDAMLNTTSQEDVIGSITLKKDGTEESGSIMLQEDQTSVRYQLNVEEDGQYYITATGDNYWSTYASITEETEDGTQDVEIINSRVELRKAGTYYLELSDYSSESQKIIKWKAGKVKDITPGEFDIELNEEKPEAYYRLTVDESGVYYVRSVKGMSVKIRDTQTGNEILSSSSFYKLKKENVYEITLGRYSWENASGKWGILKGIEKEVECDKVYINETDGVYYKFVPKTTGYYSVEGGFYDEEWNQIYSEEMLAGNAYYLAPYGRYWCIKQSEYTPIDPGGSGGKVQVKVGETYTHDMRKGGFYEFIPEETASYHFRSNENVKLEVKERIFEINGIGTLEGKVDYSVVMRAGSVYWIHLYEMDAATVTWTIEKTKTKTAVTGTKYTAVKGGSDTYDSLEHVTIGNKLAYVAKSAFSWCNLTEITWGDGIAKIGDSAFACNQKLTTVSIPDTVTELEYKAFAGCVELSDIEIPDSVEAIGGYAFEKWDIYNEGGDTAWYDAQADGDVYAGKVYYKYKGTIAEGGTVNLKAGTKGIAGYAFLDQINLTGIEIPDSVTNIGDYAFVGCEKLNKVTVPASVTKIGEKALGYLTSGKGGQVYKLEGFTIRGVAGSAAEKYAKENEFNFEAYTPEYIRGDVDADRKVSIGDVRMTLRSICKKAELNGTQKLAADVEKDGTVDIKDLRKILRYVCGKIEYL